VPALRGVPRQGLTSLVGPFALVNIGCFLRVTLQALTDFHRVFFALVGASGVLELAALAWWGTHLVRMMVTTAARRQETEPHALAA